MPGATGQAAFATRAVGRDGCFTTSAPLGAALRLRGGELLASAASCGWRGFAMALWLTRLRGRPRVSDCLRFHRMEVSLGLRGHDDECLLTLHGLCSPYQQPSTERNHENWGDGNDEGRQGRHGRGRCFALFAADHVEHVDHVDLSYGSFQNLSLTPQPMGPMRPMSSFDGNSPRSKAISPNRPPSMPSMSRVFRISKDGAIWAKVIQNVHTTSEHFALHW